MDRFSVTFTLGGKLKATLVPNLIKAIQEAGLNIEWNQGYGEDDILQAIRLCGKTIPLTVMNHELGAGNTEPLDLFCIKHRLSFDKRVDGKYEFNGEIHWWKPGLKQVQVWYDTDKEAKRVMASLFLLENALTHGKTLEQIVKRLRRVAPPVPGLQIIGTI